MLRPATRIVIFGALVAAAGCTKQPPQVNPQVAARVWELTSDDPVVVQAAVDFLLSQDRKLVVPALMERVSDLNSLAVQRVIVQDTRDPAAPKRIYHPKKYCDLIAALLQQKTGQNFGYIYDGATDRQRLQVIAAWQTWWSKNREKY
jgi:hypothetical protein